MDKVEVNGRNEAPVYKYLKEKQGGFLGSDIKCTSWVGACARGCVDAWTHALWYTYVGRTSRCSSSVEPVVTD